MTDTHLLNEGMLWADFSDKPLEARIMCAVRYYRDKYGEPNAVMMHPDAGEVNLEGIEVQTALGILPDHFWIGRVEERMDANE